MHTIISIQQNSVVIDTPLTAERMGGFKDIEGHRYNKNSFSSLKLKNNFYLDYLVYGWLLKLLI